MSSTYIPPPLRRLVHERAGDCCEYCLIPEAAVFASHEVDHTISQKHGGLTEANNLALSCTLCNQHKGTDLASLDYETGAIVPLYNPRQDRGIKHLRLSGAQILPLTPTGRATVRLLQFNHPDRVEERELLIMAGSLSLPQ